MFRPISNCRCLLLHIPHTGHRMTWNAYHRAEDIDGYLEYLAKTYPEICSVKTIGFSVQNRPLKVLRISNGNAGNKAIWMDGGIHAREWISPATVTYLINEFVESYDDQPAHIQNVDWYILPLSNPDGYEYTHSTDRLWRKNRGGVGVGRCAGVDLNRNFGFHWGGQGASKRPCAETFGGTGPFSEPETMALRDFMDNTAVKFYAYLTFHSYGQYILYPWGYDKTVPPDYKDLDRVGKLAAEVRSDTSRRWSFVLKKYFCRFRIFAKRLDLSIKWDLLDRCCIRRLVLLTTGPRAC